MSGIGIGWQIVQIVVVTVLFALTVGAILTLFERKMSALVQNRVGPNRASVFGIRLFGLLHIAADGLKSLFKEDIVPKSANKFIHFAAPFIALFAAFLPFAVMPFMDRWCDGPVVVDFAMANAGYGVEQCVGTETMWFQIADINAGLLFIFAVGSMGVYGSALAGWSSNNKFSLLGGLRCSAQMVSYEVTMLLALAGILMIYGTVDLNDMVREQGELMWGWLPKWGIFVQPLAFFLFLAAAIAETKRAPFDLPEADSELVAGYFTEYSGLKFALFMFGEFIGLVAVGALISLLFLGGWQFPFLYADGFHFGDTVWSVPYWLVVCTRILTFIVKIFFMIWLQLQIRWTLPRFRYDQVMTFGWKILLPLSLLNIFVTGILML